MSDIGAVIAVRIVILSAAKTTPLSGKLMEPIPGRMQLTLVSHYGRKEPRLADLIRRTQDVLSENLKSSFRPYQMDQVHGTIVGLEGHHVSGGIRNRNWAELGEQRRVDYAKLLNFLRGHDFPTLDIQLGGY